MKSGKYWALLIAMQLSIVAAPSLSAAGGPPTRINEFFVLGTTGCSMQLTLLSDEVTAARIGQAFELPLVEIGTDETWRAVGAFPSDEFFPGAGWNTDVAFPDEWGSAKLQEMDQTLCDSGACIWATNNIHDNVTKAWFRKTFDITGNITSATLTGSADDYAQVYVNGTLVYD